MEDIINIGEAVKSALDKAVRERGRINILIAGRTGVGKSTLINAVFQGNMATTGQGRPVTQNTREITKKDVPLSIFDTRGLEMADFNATERAVLSLVAERTKDTDHNNHIHIGWVCVAEDLRRVEQAEEELTKALSEYMPVIAIITKARADQGFRAEVQRLLPHSRNVVRVRAIPEDLDDGHTLSPMGLQELIDLTMELVPESHHRAFTAAQKVDVALKKRQAHAVVVGAAASAAGVGAVPIPFSDAVAIVPIQIAMLAGITVIYGLPLSTSLLASLVASMVTGTGATLSGRALVGALLKFIPGAGSLVGGLISAATAAGITTAFGEAYIVTLDLLFSRNGGEPPTTDEVIATFKKRYKAKGDA